MTRGDTKSKAWENDVRREEECELGWPAGEMVRKKRKRGIEGGKLVERIERK